jgi:hypothetical protein
VKFKRLLHISILVFFFVTGAEWIRSFFYVDDVWWPTERWNFSIEIDRGAVGVFVSPPMREYEESPPHLKFHSFRRFPDDICGIDKARAADLPENRSFSIAVAGIMIGKARVGFGYLSRWIVVPLWTTWLAFGILFGPGILRARRRARRRRKGLCVECGYDIRASGTRCPECGAPLGEARTGSPRKSTTRQI